MSDAYLAARERLAALSPAAPEGGVSVCLVHELGDLPLHPRQLPLQRVRPGGGRGGESVRRGLGGLLLPGPSQLGREQVPTVRQPLEVSTNKLEQEELV